MPTSAADARKFYLLFLMSASLATGIFGRSIISILQEPLRVEFTLSDGQLGVLSGLVFGLANLVVSVPAGVLADRVERTRLVAIATAVWGAASAACGLAGGFAHLVAARFVLALGLAAGNPPKISVVADLFSVRRRASALGMYYIGIPIGALAGTLGAGVIAETYGWRAAFYASGVPALLIAPLILFTVRAPPRADATGRVSKPPPLRETFGFIVRQRALLHLFLAMVVGQLMLNAVAVWGASFFIRYHGLSLSQVGVALGLTGLIGGVGTGISGFLADRAERWRTGGALLVVAASLFLAFPVLLLVLNVGNIVAAMAGWVVYLLVSYLWMPAAQATAQSLAGAARRSTVAGVVLTGTSLFGAGLGPLLTGIVSDGLKPIAGEEALRWAMIGFSTLAVWASFHALLARRTFAADLARAEAGT